MAAVYKWITKTSSKVDQAAKLIRIYCILNNINPSQTGVMLCAYVMVYGYNKRVKEGILKAGILNTESSLYNELSHLRKLGLMEGTGYRLKITSKLVGSVEEALTPKTAIMINLDNTKE